MFLVLERYNIFIDYIEAFVRLLDICESKENITQDKHVPSIRTL